MSKIRTAIIGLGKIAHGYEQIPEVAKMMKYPSHLSAIKKDKRFELVAVSDVSSKQRKIFKRKVSDKVAIYTDYRRMLKEQVIDLLVIAVPTDLHYKMCFDAIRAGIKNILCEKPITRTLAEAEKLSALVKKYRVKILVNYFRSYDKKYAKLIKLIKSKKFGPIQSINVRYNNGIFNTATHLIHLLERMFGPMSKVRSLISDAQNKKDPNASFSASAGNARVLFEGINNIDYRILEIDMRFKKDRLIISGNCLQGYDINIKTSMLDVYENVYQVVRNGKKADADIDSCIHALEVAHKAIK